MPCLGVAALHAATVVVGPAVYRYFGAGERMASLAAAGAAYSLSPFSSTP